MKLRIGICVIIISIIILFNCELIYGINVSVETKDNEETNGELVKESEKSNSDEDFRLAGVEINVSGQNVKRILGEPIKKKTVVEPSPFYDDVDLYYTTWYYADLEVCFLIGNKRNSSRPKEIGEVYSIKLTTNKFKTSRGIGIGDPVSLVNQKYGSNLEEYEIDDKNYFRYWRSTKIILFTISKEIVTEIEVHEALFELGE